MDSNEREERPVEASALLAAERHTALLDTMNEGVMVHAPDGRVVMFNRAAGDILKLSDQDPWRGEHDSVCQRAVREDGTTFELSETPVQQTFETGQPLRQVVVGLKTDVESTVWLSVNTTPLFRDGESAPSEVLCTFTDITPTILHKNRLQSQQRRLAEAQRVARLGSWTWDPNTQRVWWSEAIYELFGVDKKLTTPSFGAFLALVHPEDRQMSIDRVNAMLAGQDEFASDLRIIRPDQTCLWIHSRARAHRDPSGNIVWVEGTDQDITERKQSENSLRASEQRLGLALTAMGALTFEWDITSDRVIRHFSVDPKLPSNVDAPNSFEESRQLIHPDDLALFDRSIQDCLEHGRGVYGDYQTTLRWRRSDGSHAWLESWGVLERDSAGQPRRLVGIAADVTERVLADEELQRTSALLSAVANGTTDAVFVKDQQGRYLFANQATAQFLGRSLDEIIGATDSQLFDESSAATIRATHELVIRTRAVHSTEETLTASGVTRTYSASKGPYLDAHGNVIGVFGISRDITERKATERALTLTQCSVDNSRDSIFWINAELRFVYANHAACEKLGYALEELMSMRYFDIDNKFPAEECHEFIASLRSAGSMQFESQHLTNGGQSLDVEVNCSHLQFDGQEVVCLLARDVTERKKNLRRLQLTQFSVDHVTDIIFWLTPAGRFVNANNAACEKLGYKLEELQTMSICDIDLSLSPENVDVAWQRLLDSQSYMYHTRYLTKDQEQLDVEITSSYFEYDGSAYACSIVRDVTSRKRTERLIHTQHAVVRALAEASDLREATQALLQAIGESTGWQRGEFWLNQDLARSQLSLFTCWSHQQHGDRPICPLVRDFSAAILHRVCQTQRTEWLVDIEEESVDAQSNGEVGFQTQSQTAVAIPIAHNGQVSGVLAFFSDNRREADEQLVEVLENLSLQISQFIERKRTEERVRLFRALLDQANDFIEVSELETGKIIDVNQRACEAHGYTREEYVTLNIHDTTPALAYGDWESGLTRLRESESLTFESQHRHKNGSMFPVEISMNLIRLDKEYVVSVIREIADRKQTEERLRMSQKMEAIGQLAGGIAHDFNNLLTVINCHSQLLLDLTEQHDPFREHYAAIQHAGNRAAELTSQLLAFSRRKVSETKLVDVNEIVRGSARLLARLLREDINLELHLEDHLKHVLADSVELERIILNLAVNGRDAMLDGGTLRIATRNSIVDQTNKQQFPDLGEGDYVVLEVSDTGRGMPIEVRPRIFEPFFTTKDVGAGTGLGLAVVHGVVQQYLGQVLVDSVLGEGTTFRVLLPAVNVLLETTVVAEDASQSPTQTATVMVVDDEVAVRNVVRSVLEPQGFSVLTAQDGDKAMRMIEAAPERRIDVLLTDVIMPNMKGNELANRVQQIFPNVRTIFMSGYADGLARQPLEAACLLNKPFTPTQLLDSVRQVSP